MVGALGLLLVILFSLYLNSRAGGATPGVAAGARLRRFVAPLAAADLNAAANTDPRCDPAHPARRGLNVCDRGPLVLEFFALNARPCVRAVDALNRVAHAFAGVRFAALAAGGDRAGTRALVRSHGWRIPVAYDPTGAVGALYDVSICPMIEVAGAGGVVRGLLIGERWAGTRALRLELARLLHSGR